ncbi:hypothetical protein [Lysobacter fragariae]
MNGNHHDHDHDIPNRDVPNRDLQSRGFQSRDSRNLSSTDIAGDAFDARIRAHHAQALASVPQRTLLQLRPRDAARQPRHMRAWSLAATGAVGAIAVGLLWQRPDDATPTAPAAPVIASAATAPAVPATASPGLATDTATEGDDIDDPYAALDESPDLYLWLASSDASELADGVAP